MIFCENCKWNTQWNNVWKGCFLITGYTYNHQSKKVKVYTDLEASEKNKNNDCTHYHRKWWKFWR